MSCGRIEKRCYGLQDFEMAAGLTMELTRFPPWQSVRLFHFWF